MRIPTAVPLIELVDRIGAEAMYRIPSFTREGVYHFMHVYPDTFTITCTCEDATYRCKIKDILKPDSKACKHVVSLYLHVLPHLRSAGLLGANED